jgi:hypothetical protein
MTGIISRRTKETKAYFLQKIASPCGFRKAIKRMFGQDLGKRCFVTARQIGKGM